MNRIMTIEQMQAKVAHLPPQPKTDVLALAKAITEFEEKLPGWWWSICVCHLTRDASCGPDIKGADARLLEQELFDQGFHCDADGSLDESLRDVMQQALEAKANADGTEQKQNLSSAEKSLSSNAPQANE